jgi:hypothetical protein
MRAKAGRRALGGVLLIVTGLLGLRYPGSSWYWGQYMAPWQSAAIFIILFLIGAFFLANAIRQLIKK